MQSVKVTLASGLAVPAQLVGDACVLQQMRLVWTPERAVADHAVLRWWYVLVHKVCAADKAVPYHSFRYLGMDCSQGLLLPSCKADAVDGVCLRA
jgi:hypothetical protein